MSKKSLNAMCLVLAATLISSLALAIQKSTTFVFLGDKSVGSKGFEVSLPDGWKSEGMKRKKDKWILREPSFTDKDGTELSVNRYIKDRTNELAKLQEMVDAAVHQKGDLVMDVKAGNRPVKILVLKQFNPTMPTTWVVIVTSLGKDSISLTTEIEKRPTRALYNQLLDIYKTIKPIG